MLDMFTTVSGLKVNLDKAHRMLLGQEKTSRIKSNKNTIMNV